MFEIWQKIVTAIGGQRGTSNLPLVLFLLLLVFLACGPFSETAAEFVRPIVKHVSRLLR